MGHCYGRLAATSNYSFLPMPMLGYADIALVRAPTTMLSPFAALSGLICPAIVISQFVGLAHGASRDAS